MADKYVNKFILNGVTKFDISGDTIVPEDLRAGVTAHDKTGKPITGTSTKDSDTSDANALPAEILDGRTAYVAGQKVTGNMPNRGTQNSDISTKDGTVTIQQGYHDGSGKVGISSTEKAKLIAANIRKDITILGVKGTMSGTEDEKKQAREVTPTFSDQTVLPTGDYTCLSQVVVKAIPVTEVENAQGGITVTVG